MNQSLSDLLVLQKIDHKIERFLKEQLEKPEELETVREDLQTQEEKVETLLQKIKEMQKNEALQELELKSKEDIIETRSKQLNIIKTNKELWAIQKEIETFQERKDILEETLLEQLENIDIFQEKIKNEKLILEDKKKLFSDSTKKIEEILLESKRGIQELSNKKTEQEKKINPEDLAVYHKLFKAKKERIVVDVQEHICQGCFMKVPPNVVEQVILSEKLIFCHSCNRILFLKDKVVHS